MKIRYILLKIRKWWVTFCYKRIYPDVPFEMVTTDIAESYEDYPEGTPLAEFDAGGRHWFIYLPRE